MLIRSSIGILPKFPVCYRSRTEGMTCIMTELQPTKLVKLAEPSIGCNNPVSSARSPSAVELASLRSSVYWRYSKIWRAKAEAARQMVLSILGRRLSVQKKCYLVDLKSYVCGVNQELRIDVTRRYSRDEQRGPGVPRPHWVKSDGWWITERRSWDNRSRLLSLVTYLDLCFCFTRVTMHYQHSVV